ncbi:hypothetical protein TWF481_010354 [Arthrobotrys musiformis]|uniref:F-box domain-containing protein n=1 Tax=Arthrobotrys musiformis TaxID=47236 RepID=A0AAV9W0Q7_9PEZI
MFNEFATPLLYRTVFLVGYRPIESMLSSHHRGHRYIRHFIVRGIRYWRYDFPYRINARDASVLSVLKRLKEGQLATLELPPWARESWLEIPRQRGLEIVRFVDPDPLWETVDFEDLKLSEISLQRVSQDIAYSVGGLLFAQSQSLRKLDLEFDFQRGHEIEETMYAGFMAKRGSNCQAVSNKAQGSAPFPRLEILSMKRVTTREGLQLFGGHGEGINSLRELRLTTSNLAFRDLDPQLFWPRFPNISILTLENMGGENLGLDDLLMNCSLLRSLTLKYRYMGDYPKKESICRHINLQYLWIERLGLSPIKAKHEEQFALEDMKFLDDITELALAVKPALFPIFDLPKLRCLRFLQCEEGDERRYIVLFQRILMTGFFKGIDVLPSLKVFAPTGYQIYSLERRRPVWGGSYLLPRRVDIYDIRYNHPDLRILEADRSDTINFTD